MATKDKMIQEMMEIFDKYESAFKEISIDRLKFFRWVHEFHRYGDYQKAYRFLTNKLLKHLIIIRQILKYFDPNTFTALKIHARNQKEVVLLSNASHDFKECWLRRPRYRKRKNE